MRVAAAILVFLPGILVSTAAQSQEAPFGTNLVADPGFEHAIAGSPWQAQSGVLANMLCPDGECGLCFRRSGDGVLRFFARETDDIWAIQQQLSLPPAEHYELSFYAAGCNAVPQGSLSVSLGDLGEQQVALEGISGENYGRYRVVFDAVPSEGEGSAVEAMLTIANPALAGANLAIDDVRLVAYNDATCATDARLHATWARRSCDTTYNRWTFNADGTFSLVTSYQVAEGEFLYRYGTYCVDTSSNPARMKLHLDRQCYASDIAWDAEPGDACEWTAGDFCYIESCNAMDITWYATYGFEGEDLLLRVQDCPVDSLDLAPRYTSGEPTVNDLSPCEAVYECEDLAVPLLGKWGRKVCDAGGEEREHFWVFFTEKRFIEYFTLEGDYFEYSGSYQLNAAGNPSQVNLSYNYARIDHAAEEGEDCRSGADGEEHCFDYFKYLSNPMQGVFAIDGDMLHLADGDCRPADPYVGPAHQRGTALCVDAAEYGQGAPPEYCGAGEGEYEHVLNLLQGYWYSRVCAATGIKPRVEWYSFDEDGRFQSDYQYGVAGAQAFYRFRARGHYELDVSEYPYRVTLHYERSCITQGPADNPSVCFENFSTQCGMDSCSDVPFHAFARVGFDGNQLLISTGTTCMPEGLSGADSLSVSDSDETYFSVFPRRCMDVSTVHAPDAPAPACETQEGEGASGDGEAQGGDGEAGADGEAEAHDGEVSVDGEAETGEGEAGADGEAEEFGDGEVDPVEGEAETGNGEAEYSEGEGQGEGEGGASTLFGSWGAYVCSKELGDVWDIGFTFREDGTFTSYQVVDDGGKGEQRGATGTYTAETSTITLHVTRRCVADDAIEEGGPCLEESESDCTWDSCVDVDETITASFTMSDGTLTLSLGDCPGNTVALRQDSGACFEAGTVNLDAPCDVPPAMEAIEGFRNGDTNGDDQLSAQEAGNMGISEEDFAELDANDDGQVTAAELLLAAGQDAPRHSSDTNLDGEISLAELLRAIQIYNAGGYACAPLAASEDGYLPQVGDTAACPPHASDYAPVDGKISLSELLRAIQLYNSGGYQRCEAGGEDDFCL